MLPGDRLVRVRILRSSLVLLVESFVHNQNIGNSKGSHSNNLVPASLTPRRYFLNSTTYFTKEHNITSEPSCLYTIGVCGKEWPQLFGWFPEVHQAKLQQHQQRPTPDNNPCSNWSHPSNAHHTRRTLLLHWCPHPQKESL